VASAEVSRWPVSDDCTRETFPHGRGESGDAPCAVVECWVYGFKDGQPVVTFGGFPPQGDRAWKIAVWLAIAAEAARRAAEQEVGHVLPPS